MTTWGFIGSGNIGSTVARLAVAAGHDVVLSNSRGPETLGRPGRRARPARAGGDRGRGGPRRRRRRRDDPAAELPQVPVEELAGKVVIDTMNYYPQRDGDIAELDDESTTSSELLQAHLPERQGGQGLQQHLLPAPRCAPAPRRRRRPQRPGDRRRRRRGEGGHAGCFDEIGYDTVDLGPLSEGWRTPADTAAYGVMAVNPEAWDQGARPVPAPCRGAASAAQRRRRPGARRERRGEAAWRASTPGSRGRVGPGDGSATRRAPCRARSLAGGLVL